MNNDNFLSLDRLVEFGLGMSMARQMVNVMNESMQNMYVPGSIKTISATPLPTTIYVAIEGSSIGPLSESEFSQLVTNKTVTKDTLAWMPGMQNWQPIEKIPAILKIVALSPPPLPTNM